MQYPHDKAGNALKCIVLGNFPLIFNDLLQDCCAERLIASVPPAKAKEQVTGCNPHVGDRRTLRG
jgi:hypothetical protein